MATSRKKNTRKTAKKAISTKSTTAADPKTAADKVTLRDPEGKLIEMTAEEADYWQKRGRYVRIHRTPAVQLTEDVKEVIEATDPNANKEPSAIDDFGELADPSTTT